MYRWRSGRPDRRLVVSGICGIICVAVAGPALGAESTFDGFYMGKRLLTKGPGPVCPAEDDVSAIIRGKTLTFTDSGSRSFTIGFSPRQDGSFRQAYVDIGGSYVIIRGRIVGDVIEADVTNAPCQHHWHLKKEHRSQ